ncbi:hypothetical protein K488DRAFT_74886 [Vararia minispora EC-137]|uniref:Uncharacterized protein n=1 Tax=Vararia minispora EC-137 TaxID=1314806 RepID=A0ACB8Q5F9_9AGAM|nr:hypothetical protein K488DRAFT_74886 [Vararia minispora EC-137]
MSVPTFQIEINRLMDFNSPACSAHDKLLWREQQLVSTLITMDTGPAAHSEAMDVEHTQDSMVDHLTSVTTPLDHLISVFWFSHVAMMLDTMQHVHNPATFYDIVDTYIACKCRHSYLHNALWLQDLSPTTCTTYYDRTMIWIDLPNHKMYPYDVWQTNTQLVGPVGSVDMGMLMAHVVRYWTLRLISCSNARAHDYGALDNIPSVARNVFDRESTAIIKVETSEDDSSLDIPENAGDSMSDKESILFIDEDALDIYHDIIPRPIPPTASHICYTPGNSTRA